MLPSFNSMAPSSFSLHIFIFPVYHLMNLLFIQITGSHQQLLFFGLCNLNFAIHISNQIAAGRNIFLGHWFGCVIFFPLPPVSPSSIIPNKSYLSFPSRHFTFCLCIPHHISLCLRKLILVSNCPGAPNHCTSHKHQGGFPQPLPRTRLLHLSS